MFPTGSSGGGTPQPANSAQAQQQMDRLVQVYQQIQQQYAAQQALGAQTSSSSTGAPAQQQAQALQAQQQQQLAAYLQQQPLLQQQQLLEQMQQHHQQNQQLAQLHQQHYDNRQQQAQAVLQAHAALQQQQKSYQSQLQQAQAQSRSQQATPQQLFSSSSAGQPQFQLQQALHQAVSSLSQPATAQTGNSNLGQTTRQPNLDDVRRAQQLALSQTPGIQGTDPVSDAAKSLCVDTSNVLGVAAHNRLDPSPAGAGTQTPQQRTEEDSENALEKKKLSDQLEQIEKNRKLCDQQIEAMTRRIERYKVAVAEAPEKENEQEDLKEAAAESIPLWQKIAAENKKRTEEARLRKPKLLDFPDMSCKPLYFEPRDVPGMRELMERNKVFRPKLIKMLMNRKKAEEEALEETNEQYTRHWEEWKRGVDKWEKNPKKIARDAKNRALFETVFPEIKKAREDKERSGRSERIQLRDGSGFLAVATDKTDEERKILNAVAIPPLMCKQLGFRTDGFFDNKHGVVKNAAKSNREMIENFLASWSDEEKELFRNRLQVVGKNYANIATYLQNKSVKDCVLYYYLTKKRQNYKSILPKRKKRIAKSYKAPIMPTREELDLYQQVPQSTNPTAPIVPDNRCFKCQQKLDPAVNPGRVLTRASYEVYGISAKRGTDIKICNKCQEQVFKMRFGGRCLVKVCGKKKVKATKNLPPRWKQMDDRQRAFILSDMGIPREIFKVCGPCCKKIAKRVDQLLSGDLDDKVMEFELEAMQGWQDEEMARLLQLVDELGADWSEIADQMEGRSADECRQQYDTRRRDEDSEEGCEDEEEKGDRGEEDQTMDEETQDVPEETPKVRDAEEEAVKKEEKPEGMEVVVEPNESSVPAVPAAPVPEPVTSPPEAAADPQAKGSITAGTPLRPPSVSIIEPPQSAAAPQPQPAATAAVAAAAGSASARGTPQPMQTMQSQLLMQKLLADPHLYSVVAKSGGDQDLLRRLVEQFSQGVMGAGMSPHPQMGQLGQQPQQQQQQQQQVQQAQAAAAQLAQQLAQQQQTQVERFVQEYAKLSDQELRQLLDNAKDQPQVRLIVQYAMERKKQQQDALMRQQQQQQQQQLAQQQQQQQAAQLKQQQQNLLRLAQAQQQHQLGQSTSQQQQVGNSAAQAQSRSQLDGTIAILETQLQPYVQRMHEIREYLAANTAILPAEVQLTLTNDYNQLNTSATQIMTVLTQLKQSAAAHSAAGGDVAGGAGTQSIPDDTDVYEIRINEIRNKLGNIEEEERKLTALKQRYERSLSGPAAFNGNRVVELQQTKVDLGRVMEQLKAVEHNKASFKKQLDDTVRARDVRRVDLQLARRGGLLGTSMLPQTATPSISMGAKPETPQPFQNITQQQQLYLNQMFMSQRRAAAANMQQQEAKTAVCAAPSPAPSISQPRRETSMSFSEMKTAEAKKGQSLVEKVVQEELALAAAGNSNRSMASQSQQQQQPTQPPPQQHDSVKRKSGLEMLYLPNTPPVSRHPLQAPAMRRVASPSNRNNNLPSARTITGTSPLSVAVSSSASSGGYSNPSTAQNSPRVPVPSSNFVQGLAFPQRNPPPARTQDARASPAVSNGHAQTTKQAAVNVPATSSLGVSLPSQTPSSSPFVAPSSQQLGSAPSMTSSAQQFGSSPFMTSSAQQFGSSPFVTSSAQQYGSTPFMTSAAQQFGSSPFMTSSAQQFGSAPFAQPSSSASFVTSSAQPSPAPSMNRLFGQQPVTADLKPTSFGLPTVSAPVSLNASAANLQPTPTGNLPSNAAITSQQQPAQSTVMPCSTAYGTEFEPLSPDDEPNEESPAATPRISTGATNTGASQAAQPESEGRVFSGLDLDFFDSTPSEATEPTVYATSSSASLPMPLGLILPLDPAAANAAATNGNAFEPLSDDES